MLWASGALVLVEVFLLAYCVLSIATTPADQVRRLPKTAWLVLVVVLPLLGGVLWLLVGRPEQPAGASATGRRSPAQASSPDDDPAFLEQLRARAAAQRAAAERARREAERSGDADPPPPA
jgi:cytochrome c-type biogenesis protein CcmH/NrfG